jgi:hypothetical protein
VVTGTLIMESLREDARLDELNLRVRRMYRLRPGGTVRWQPETWSFLEFEADDVDAAPLADVFADVLAQPGWYTDFHSPTETFVVFPGRIFRYPRGDAAGRAAAETHGRLLGVPDSQLDWPK